VLEDHPAFRRILEESRQRCKPGQGISTAQMRRRLKKRRRAVAAGAVVTEKLDVVRGRGNVYRDLGVADPDVRQLKAILAAEIIKALDREGLSVRGARARTGIVTIINRLGSRVEVKVRVRRPRTASDGAPA
jgi:hypothetical protein